MTLDRQKLLRNGTALSIAFAAEPFLPLYTRSRQGQSALTHGLAHDAGVQDGRGGKTIELVIDGLAFPVNGRRGNAIAINGSIFAASSPRISGCLLGGVLAARRASLVSAVRRCSKPVSSAGFDCGSDGLSVISVPGI